MRIKEGFTLRSIVGQYVVIGEGIEQVDFNKMITMNDSAAYLWQGVEGKDFTVEDLTKLLTDKYDVAEEKAASDAARIASKWIEAGLVEE
ncbi:MAG: PqqD family protein [Bacteroidales bacterium]|nr:PqqD family protein [Bacteroidales bacterium]